MDAPGRHVPRIYAQEVARGRGAYSSSAGCSMLFLLLFSMTPTACTPTAGVVPGLGFQHLGGDDATSSGARGRPTAQSANDASSCCAQCDAASASAI